MLMSKSMNLIIHQSPPDISFSNT